MKESISGAPVPSRRRFVPAAGGIEDVENYKPGGLHPISIGDCFSHGRYRAVHKLGYGGSSTVWLARDNQRGQLVALKVLRADESTGDTPELAISNLLRRTLQRGAGLQLIEDSFFVQGVNGTHMVLISPLAGSTVRALLNSPGRTEGSRRLRADLARKVAKQAAMALHYMHSAGVVHGDLTTSNILFSLAPPVLRWSDAEIYTRLGKPETERVRTCDGPPLPSCAPAKVVAPLELTDASLLQESIVVGDFGQSYRVSSPPPGYVPATADSYRSPEARFEGRAGLEADIWALGLAIFEIRAGSCPIAPPWCYSPDEILVNTVQLLGRLSDPWWSAWGRHALWFKENGDPKSAEEQDRSGEGRFADERTSIREELRSIGRYDDPPSTEDGRDGPMIEPTGTVLGEKEIHLLGDLLEKMLKYRPEERVTIHEVLAHPWFAFTN